MALLEGFIGGQSYISYADFGLNATLSLLVAGAYPVSALSSGLDNPCSFNNTSISSAVQRW